MKSSVSPFDLCSRLYVMGVYLCLLMSVDFVYLATCLSTEYVCVCPLCFKFMTIADNRMHSGIYNADIMDVI